MYSAASPTVRIFSASSSEISVPNSSSRLMMSSTRSSESAFRSSTNDASGLTSSSSAPSCSTTIFLRRSYVVATDSLLGAGCWCRRPVAAALPCDAPKHAVHQASHGLSTVGACQLDPLGDGHPGRRGRVWHLPYGATEQCAVHPGKAGDRVLRRASAD